MGQDIKLSCPNRKTNRVLLYSIQRPTVSVCHMVTIGAQSLSKGLKELPFYNTELESGPTENQNSRNIGTSFSMALNDPMTTSNTALPTEMHMPSYICGMQDKMSG